MMCQQFEAARAVLAALPGVQIDHDVLLRYARAAVSFDTWYSTVRPSPASSPAWHSSSASPRGTSSKRPPPPQMAVCPGFCDPVCLKTSAVPDFARFCLVTEDLWSFLVAKTSFIELRRPIRPDCEGGRSVVGCGAFCRICRMEMHMKDRRCS